MKSEFKFTISLIIAILFGVIGNATSTGAKTGGHYFGLILFSAIVFGIAFWLLGKLSGSKSQQDQTEMNQPTRDKIIQLTEQKLTKVVKEQHENSPLSDSPFEGTAIMHAVTERAEKYKQEFKAEKNRLGLNENEIDELVDEATSNVLDRFIEF